MKVDKFGNLITNFTDQDLPQLFERNPPPFRILVGKAEITKINETYSQGAPGDVFAIIGSTGYLELAVNRGAASKTLGVERGADVGVLIG